ncbi:MAG TPA: hypothetical protein VM122_00655 [Usitatibacter sp.]|nr:hypothetical protein [Usitatibacter sp.]
MRIPLLLLGLATAALPAVAQVAANSYSPGTRLDRPGALEALAATNPGHYQRAVEIIRAAQTMPCGLRLRALLAEYEAHDVRCSPALIFTSYPAKRDLAFTLDDTPYALRVSLVDDAVLSPARR